MNDKETFKQELKTRTAEIEQLIGTYLPEETGHQKTILEAMNYSMTAGGKRVCDSFYGRSGDDPHLFPGPRRPSMHGR